MSLGEDTILFFLKMVIKDMRVTLKKTEGNKEEKRSTYNDPNNSTICSASSKPFSLHQK